MTNAAIPAWGIQVVIDDHGACSAWQGSQVEADEAMASILAYFGWAEAEGRRAEAWGEVRLTFPDGRKAVIFRDGSGSITDPPRPGPGGLTTLVSRHLNPEPNRAVLAKLVWDLCS